MRGTRPKTFVTGQMYRVGIWLGASSHSIGTPLLCITLSGDSSIGSNVLNNPRDSFHTTKRCRGVQMDTQCKLKRAVAEQTKQCHLLSCQSLFLDQKVLQVGCWLKKKVQSSTRSSVSYSLLVFSHWRKTDSVFDIAFYVVCYIVYYVNDITQIWI